jgi:putative methionine-R-sulfoxide reductase with GAF domain
MPAGAWLMKKETDLRLERATASFEQDRRMMAAQMRMQATDMSERALSMYVDAVEAIATSIQMRSRYTDFRSDDVQAEATNSRISASDYYALLNQQLEQAVSMSGASMGNIQYFDSQTKTLKIEAQYGFDDQFLNFFKSVRPGKAACGTALRKKRPVKVADVTRSSIFRNTPTLEILLDAKIRAVSSLPLIGPEGDVLGVLSMHYTKPQTYDRMPAAIVFPGRSIAFLMRSFSPARA